MPVVPSMVLCIWGRASLLCPLGYSNFSWRGTPTIPPQFPVSLSDEHSVLHREIISDLIDSPLQYMQSFKRSANKEKNVLLAVLFLVQPSAIAESAWQSMPSNAHCWPWCPWKSNIERLLARKYNGPVAQLSCQNNTLCYRGWEFNSGLWHKFWVQIVLWKSLV